MRPIRSRSAAILLAVAILAGLSARSAGNTAEARHVSGGCARQPSVALTFDDGPNPPFTEQILATLRDRSARATFFAAGQQVEAHPEVVRAEIAAGMEVGLHSYTHAQALPEMSHREFGGDLGRATSALESVLGRRPVLFRAPYGHTSATMLEELRKAGYVSIGWDTDSRDWSNDTSVDEIVSNVVDQAHAGAIVLMHDAGLGGGNPDRTKTIAALPRIIDGLRAKGYALVTVSDLIGLTRSSAGVEVTCSAS